MRTFGESNVKRFEFKLEGSDRIYGIPLAADMPYSILDRMRNASAEESFPAQVDMLRKYMGNVVDELTVGTLSDILRAWSEESNKTGASVGES